MKAEGDSKDALQENSIEKKQAERNRERGLRSQREPTWRETITRAFFLPSFSRFLLFELINPATMAGALFINGLDGEDQSLDPASATESQHVVHS